MREKPALFKIAILAAQYVGLDEELGAAKELWYQGAPAFPRRFSRLAKW